MATRSDYQDVLENEVLPEIVDNVVINGMDKLYTFGTKSNINPSGNQFKDTNAMTVTGAGGAFTRSDANPASLTKTWAQPYWNKKRYHEAVNIRREDLDDNGNATPNINMIADATKTAADLVMSYIFDGVMTQIKSDVDSAGAYSDASITRTTPITSYEEATDTAMTKALLRAGMVAVRGKQPNFRTEDYNFIFEDNVWNVVQPLISVQGTDTFQYRQNDVASVDAGYPIVQTFDQVKVNNMYGMTTGDAYMLKKSDLQIAEHMPMQIEEVQLDAYELRFVVRMGVNAWVRHPQNQCKWTNKDNL